MTDKLLCPFCNKPLQPTHRIEDEYFCKNDDCPQTSLTWIGTSSLWKAFADTKKKLDKATDWLEQVATPEKCDDDLCRKFTKRKLAEIKQITKNPAEDTQQKMTPEEFADLELLVNATFK